MSFNKNGVVSEGYLGTGNSVCLMKGFTMNPNMVDLTWNCYTPYWTLTKVTDTSIFLTKNTSDSSSTIALYNNTCKNSFTIGTTYTASMYIFKNGAPYNVGDGYISTYPSYNNKSSYCSRNDGFFSVTFTVKANSSGGIDTWMIHYPLAGGCTDGTPVELRYLKIEKGNKATPWCLHSSNSNYLNIDNRSYKSGLIATDFMEV